MGVPPASVNRAVPMPQRYVVSIDRRQIVVANEPGPIPIFGASMQVTMGDRYVPAGQPLRRLRQGSHILVVTMWPPPD